MQAMAGDLLRDMAEGISTRQALTRVKVMPAGANLFEFEDTGDTFREIRGVVLSAHGRNVLWDKPVSEGQVTRTDDPEARPACASTDGKYGNPREGFIHLGLPANLGKTPQTATARATGQELLSCADCPYNQFRSVGLLPYTKQGSQQGKAVTNQRSIYILLPDRRFPVELRITPSSLTAFDAYLKLLVDASVPIQAVETVFTLERMERGAQKWSVVKFTRGANLTLEQFQAALETKTRFREQITAMPTAPWSPEGPETGTGDNGAEAPVEGTEEEIPF
jgi:hypothetical protein